MDRIKFDVTRFLRSEDGKPYKGNNIGTGTFANTTNAANGSESKSSGNSGPKNYTVVYVFVTLFVIGLIVFFYYRYKKKNETGEIINKAKEGKNGNN